MTKCYGLKIAGYGFMTREYGLKVKWYGSWSGGIFQRLNYVDSELWIVVYNMSDMSLWPGSMVWRLSDMDLWLFRCGLEVVGRRFMPS